MEPTVPVKSPDHAGVHFPPPLLFVAGLVGGVLLHRWLAVPLLPVRFRFVGLLAGWCLIASWVGLTGWAIAVFLRHRTAMYPNRPASTLVTRGPYAFSRNPMYLALSGLYVGVSLLVNSIWPVVLFPGVLVSLYLLVIRREERYLAATFASDYTSYRDRVRRWL